MHPNPHSYDNKILHAVKISVCRYLINGKIPMYCMALVLINKQSKLKFLHPSVKCHNAVPKIVDSPQASLLPNVIIN